jgi:hypothetical protein
MKVDHHGPTPSECEQNTNMTIPRANRRGLGNTTVGVDIEKNVIQRH